MNNQQYPDSWWINTCNVLPFEVIANNDILDRWKDNLELFTAYEYDETYGDQIYNSHDAMRLVITIPMVDTIFEVHQEVCEALCGECDGFYIHPIRYILRRKTDFHILLDLHEGGNTIGIENLDQIFEYLDLKRFNKEWYKTISWIYDSIANDIGITRGKILEEASKYWNEA
jgi:hypothetical protein